LAVPRLRAVAMIETAHAKTARVDLRVMHAFKVNSAVDSTNQEFHTDE
jgi:hypothetical protein